MFSTVNTARVMDIILRGGVDEKTFKQVRGKMKDNNRKTLMVFSYVALCVFPVLLTMTFIVSSLQSYRYAYSVGLALTVVIWWLAKFRGEKSELAVTAGMYAFEMMLFMVGILMGTIMSPNELAATYIAFLLAVPQMFTDRPWRIFVLVLIAEIIFIIMAVQYKNPVTMSADITNCLAFGILSIILAGFSIDNRINRYALEHEIRFLAERDQLTGLMNRHRYQRFIDASESMRSTCFYCLYVDANGLHELNDSEGHEAGDLMLRSIADVMQQLFGTNNTYRIGGDEFAAFGRNKNLEELEILVREMKETLESLGYHVAVGLGMKNDGDFELNDIIRRAEMAMYKDKAEYYLTSGKDRRRRMD